MASLKEVFYHLVLPPQLPGTQDAHVQSSSDDVLARLTHAAMTLGKLAGQEQLSTWNAIRHSLRQCAAVHALGRLEKQSLIAEFGKLEHGLPLILYIAEQNAALFVRRDFSDGADVVLFEAFEASPPSPDVLASEGALVWDFPHCAAEIPFGDFQKPSLQDALASFLEKSSMEPLRQFQAHTTKAQTSIVESRDTCSPALVTHLLIPLLESIGCSGGNSIPQLRKRVRDDTNFEAAELPWRRLPFWLVLRVCTQRQLQLSLGYTAGRACYKFLIIIMLVELLDECSGSLAPEMTITLRNKICRRLAKLEQDKSQSPAVYNFLFTAVQKFLKGSIMRSTKLVETAWDRFKQQTTRPIPLLPQRADHQAQYLSLPNSGEYLQSVLNLPRTQRRPEPSYLLPESRDGTIRQVEEFTDTYFQLAKLESEIKTGALPQLYSEEILESRCLKLSDAILGQFAAIGGAYDADPEQMSIFILSLFTLWERMDTCVTEVCPLLLQYHPVFTPEILDVLHLPSASDMERLQGIQAYLRKRCESCEHQTTIFSEPEKESFTVQYATQSAEMQSLLARIEHSSETSRQAKKAELDTWWQTYDDHSLSISSGTCTCTIGRDGLRDIRGCKKCFKWRVRNRMKIYAHEDFLPHSATRQAAVIFELGIPKSIAAYRNATWKIFGLAYPAKVKSQSPPKLLNDYEPLAGYGQSHSPGGITIASTSKPFRGTHYKVAKKRMRASESDVLYPNGLTFFLFDVVSNTFVKDFNKPLTFQHLCGIHVPLALQSSVMPTSIHPPSEVHGPSSYDTVASETRCPPTMSIHEFAAYQRLLSGKARRWLTMLVEIGASDVNFSSESTMHMFNHLAVQAGPARDEMDVLRDVHATFKDASFCNSLGLQIASRLRSIKSNWREVNCMEVLITLSLRLFTLCPSKTLAIGLLEEARDTTLQWITRLRNDVRSATERSAEETAARYSFTAALLCRRTFSHFSDSDKTIPQNDLSTFVQASLAVQENLLVDLSKLSPALKSMLIRDTKIAYNIQSLLLRSIQTFPQSIGRAINSSWSSNRVFYAGWQTVSSKDSRWVVSTMTPSTRISEIPQVVHYNFIGGHLLVDGKPLGRLPRDIRESDAVKQLFDNQHLQAFPSAEFGMSYVLSTQIENHEIHFGTRDGQVIVRARNRDGLLEYIPPNLFSSDIPCSLVINCRHWLNLDTQCVEVRRKPVLWKTRVNDWIIDVVNRKGHRSNHTFLIDPNSHLFKQVASIFRHFEDARKITVFQPTKRASKLSVELRHLELSFFVNGKGLLQCRELEEEIDLNQDAGTLYGFDSKIVLRHITNPNRRSIIAPWGNISTKRRGMHVAVRAAGSEEYARFEIDDVLGRLYCPSEPRLLYAKAQFHAFTSFVIPDPLTGRTGTEEAMRILQSGYCQPWLPLANAPIRILKAIAEITPSREYYPKNKQTLQTVSWSTDLTMTIQHDAYESVVQNILEKSDRLRVFQSGSEEHDVQLSTYSPTHLRKRGVSQRLLYERDSDNTKNGINRDQTYKSRAQKSDSTQAVKVYQIVRLLQTQPLHLNVTRGLSEMLRDWPLIGGFHNINTSQLVLNLSDLTEGKIQDQWGTIVNACRSCGPEEYYSLMFLLTLMSLNSSVDMNAIKIFVAFASVPELKTLQAPNAASFNGYKPYEAPTAQSLFRIISVDLPEKPQRRTDKAQKEHRRACENDAQRLALHLANQWPREVISLDGFDSDVMDTGLALERLVPEWHRLHKNWELSEYVKQIQDILEQYNGPDEVAALVAWEWKRKSAHLPRHGPVTPSMSKDLLTKPLASDFDTSVHEGITHSSASSSHTSGGHATAMTLSKEMTELGRILNVFSSQSNSLRQQYGRDIEASLVALGNAMSQSKPLHPIPDLIIIAKRMHELRTTIKEHFAQLRNFLSVHDDRFQWLDLANLWPCNTSLEMLQQLRSNLGCSFGEGVKEAIVSHGILITRLQRLVRIHQALNQDRETQIQEELGNDGHGNWNPLEWPDWLLLEIDSNLLIRQEQVDVAHAIITPKSQDNTVLQLNMGRGKTSCIVPMAMAVLGNGKQLSRLIVPKPLLLPTAQMIQSRLGGLVGREIRHLPFSRRIRQDSATLQLYEELHSEILHSQGVVLNAPEYVLSYKLSGLQHLVNSEMRIARKMLDFQSWLDSTCRDVMDESDVSLAVKTQLIYPSGKQITVDGHPHRWQVAQSLLSLVEDHLPELRRKFPRSIEVIQRPRGYPMIYILQEDVEEDLHRRIIDKVCTGRMVFLRFAGITSHSQYEEIRQVLLEPDLDNKLLERMSALFVDKNVAAKILLLVRGLLRNRILLLCLKKRWNVQYGLHPGRHPIAVPFEAKGVPSEQAEFGHPDAAILFTCLAFYYTGLSQDQFGIALRHILASHDPSSEYDRWTSSCDTLPEALHHWNVINVDDKGQVGELWKHLRTSRSVLDHYMNHFVFPAHAKQFGVKLQASGWDLPLFSQMDESAGAATTARTTGFSGTNDNKMMLPLTIRQGDLPSLQHTNAEVLTYLLQARNRSYHLAARGGKRLSELELLAKLFKEGIRVLIDAGAYILEMSNESLADEWMKIDTSPPAAVFFGADDRAWVRYRGVKAKVPLLATPFVNSLDNCLVYFDHAHVRGVDLKLPQRACGALTLALGQTKDHTVQAAMRLRQLATTQSLCFFAFPETHQSILDVCKMNRNARIDSSNVIHWLLEQACRGNEQLQGLFISQGSDFCNRKTSEWENPNCLSNSEEAEAYARVLQHPEQRTLEQLYGSRTEDSQSPGSSKTTSSFPQIQSFMQELDNLRHAAGTNLNGAPHSSALEEVEQEREVEFQVEEVREMQRPTHYAALEFPGLHPAIYAFARTGILCGEKGYEHVFAAMSHTSVGRAFNINGTESRMFVSEEFMRTIETNQHDAKDNFLRPVEWILYCPSNLTALIIIAEEAEFLIPEIRAQTTPAKVHLITYSAPVTKKMLSFSRLQYYALPTLPRGHVIPEQLTIELGIFAGRLYMEFDGCAPFMEYIEKARLTKHEHNSTAENTRLLLEWLSLRRKGQDIMHTPVGYLLQGRPLDKGHGFFTTHHVVVKSISGVVEVSDEEDVEMEDD